MNETRILMGMPITIEVLDASITAAELDKVFSYFEYVDEKFSTYKDTSEISRINYGEMTLNRASDDMKLVFSLAARTKTETDGFFDIECDGFYDPSGLVKGWAILNAAQLLQQAGFQNVYIDAGGDIQIYGTNAQGDKWRVGIRNPFNMNEIVKVISVTDCGIATSGTYIRGQHVYNPKAVRGALTEILSLTVIGPNIYEADRFATAAFAMQRDGIIFIENLDGFEGYMIDVEGQATLTSGFERYVLHA